MEKTNRESHFMLNSTLSLNKNRTNRLGGGIKRGIEVPKAWEGCSFSRPYKNQAKRLEC